ncbi:hypothetical protein [Sphingomonas sp. ID0503]|uniref:hypothetical protein n=1 Tax=Sphingomonas sp. ID0503 TaxID=3399691 RepID=UPI003AFA928E
MSSVCRLGHRQCSGSARRDGNRWLRASLPLEPRGAYHLSGEARHVWEHSIVEMDRTRWSITFRTPSEKGRSILRAASLQP